jgi:ribonuclease BN (tRNA processing enzyme)
MSYAFRLSRREVLRSLIGSAALQLVTSASDPLFAGTEQGPQDQESQMRASLKELKGTKLILLGTGAGPVPGFPRHMQSSLLLHNGAAYIVDCGLGVTDQFARTGLPFSAIRSIFITHHHPDHNIEYGPLLILGWVNGLPQSVAAYGPPPLKAMTQDYLRSMKTTIDFWAEDFKRPPFEMIECTEVSKDGPVAQDQNVKVSCVTVQHPPVRPALGYRFDFSDRSIAFSGDTVPIEAIAKMARGVDVLVHEAMDVPATEELARRRAGHWNGGSSYDTIMHHMNADHSPVEDVGRIAQRAEAKMLVLSHLTPPDPMPPDDEWVEKAAKYYKGPILVARDLMVI